MSKIVNEIRKDLLSMQDIKYRDFQAKLIPNVDKEYFIGIKTPELRKYAKDVLKRDDVSEFFDDLPHKYFDENQVHAFAVSGMKNFDECMVETEKFLPYVNNWATCDQFSPKVFKKHREELLKYIKVWIKSKETYTVRFAIGMLMEHFLNEDFKEAYPKMVSKVKSDEYYINMMIAWYFATALAKQYDAVIGYFEEGKLDKWVNNKSIQKACESYRVSDEHKAYLKTLKK